MTNRPVFSVIIPTCNRADLIGLAIESVLRQRDDGMPFEIIVVDNNSHDATAAVVHRYIETAGDWQVRYLFEPRQGVSYARNLGIDHARADLIVFLDDDLEATPGWLRRFKQAFDEHPQIDCIGGYVRPALGRPRAAMADRCRVHWPDIGASRSEGRTCGSRTRDTVPWGGQLRVSKPGVPAGGI